ncbi:MAG TPA: hypothetical protein VGM26_01375 [Rhizomicrobium sp.]|jgi:hypothetical protein
MKSEEALSHRLELWLGHLLGYGTWIGSVLIAAGLAIPSVATGSRLILAGIGFFIVLPVARVATMLTYFLMVGDKRLSLVAALVLGVICAGICIGLKL